MASLKGNIVLNLVNTLTGVIFPVITFPYAARVLLPEGIGAVNFLNAIIGYILLFTSLGIPLYGVREIARYRDDPRKLNQITAELFTLNIILCVLGYVAVWLLALWVPEIHVQRELFYILSLAIFFNAIGVQWFYQAVEDFRFITIRGIIIRFLCAAALFIFVKSPSDLLIYGLVVVGSTVGNNFINFLHLRKYVRMELIAWRDLDVKRHLGPALKVFVLSVIISVYIYLNTIMLGFIQDDTAVGLYTAGNKISHIAVMMVTSLGAVMLPRCSHLISAGKMSEFAEISTKATRLVLCTSIPVVAGMMILASPIVRLFCGDDFAEAVPVLVWIAPIILVIGLSNVLGIQILYPQGKEKIVIWSTFAGAVFNFTLNFWLLPAYSYVGAAIGTLVAEVAVTGGQLLLGRRYIPVKFDFSLVTPYLAATAVMSAVLIVIMRLMDDGFAALGVCAVAGAVIYAAILLAMRDPMIKMILRFLHLTR